MSLPLLPDHLAGKLVDLEPAWLQKEGIRLLMLDFDNTIVPYTTNEPTEEMKRWLEALLASPIELCVVSNSRNDRVKIFCQKYGLDCITHAGKPFSRGIRQCMQKYALSPEQCALAGDQIYTDTLGANCAGVRSILVKAIHNHNFWLKLRHMAELPFIFAARKRSVTK